MGRRQAFADHKKKQKQEKGQELPWSDLYQRIDKGNLIPIISNAVMNDQIFDLDDDQIVGISKGEENPLGWSIEEQLADTWAKVIDFPLPQQHWMPRVALFDRVVNSADDLGAKTSYLNFLKEYFLFICKQDGVLGKDKIEMFSEDIDQYGFADIADMAGYPKSFDGGLNTLEMLAKMELPIYITTSPFDFLERAIKRDRRKPRTQVCFWSQEPTNYVDNSHKTAYEFEPTAKNPLVYHIFGLEAYPESMVLNEDDYFDFLVTISKDSDSNKPLLPLYLTEAITKSSLLLLGYSLRDWDFRVMFRGLINPTPSPTRKYNLAIQLDPRKFTDSATAKNVMDYLHKYFDEEDFAVKLDSAHGFVTELYEKWSQRS